MFIIAFIFLLPVLDQSCSAIKKPRQQCLSVFTGERFFRI
jgi:hypothetical protein